MSSLEKTHNTASTPTTKSWFLPKISAINTKYSLCQLTRLHTALPIQIFYFETLCTLFQYELLKRFKACEQYLLCRTANENRHRQTCGQVWVKSPGVTTNSKIPCNNILDSVSNTWEILLAITGYDTTVQHVLWKHLASSSMSFNSEMFYIK